MRKFRERAVERMPRVVVGESRTKQSFRDECNVNNIMSRYRRAGILSHFNKFQGDYGDFTDAPEYHDAMLKVTRANEMFLTLPAETRARFANDPGQFLAFVSDEGNLPEMVKLGLAKAREAPVDVVQKVEVVNPPPVVDK